MKDIYDLTLKREAFEKSTEPRHVRQKRIRAIMEELKYLFWEIYELDGEDKNFDFQYIMQFSNLQPRRLTVKVIDDLEFKNFRELIKERIMERKSTIKDTAALLGIGRPAFTNFLLDKADLSVDLALKIEKEFNIDAESMLRMESRKQIAFVRVRTMRPRF